MSEQKPPTAYRVDDQELLLGFYKRVLWNRIIPRIPASVTPNSLTVIGQALGVLSCVATAGATAGYPILYIVAAVLLLAYLTFDNIDGAHARRTGQTSPLGEFLDHGLDGVASGAILILTGLMLQLDGFTMTLLCGIGSLGFTMLFWQQFRTGVLTIPKVSSTEGVSLLMVCLVLLGVLGEPAWIKFATDHLTAGTIIVPAVILAYVVACIPPVILVRKATGVAGWELVPLAAAMGAQVAFAGLGANGIIAAASAGIIGADVTARLIVLRHRGETGPFMSPIQWLSSAPVLVPAVAPGVWTATGWASVSLGVIAVSYAVTMWRGTTELMRPVHDEQRAVSH